MQEDVKRLPWDSAVPIIAHTAPNSTCREGKQEHPAWSGTEQALPQPWEPSGVAALQAILILQTGHALIQHPLCSQNPPALVMCLKINWDHGSDKHQNTTRQH